MAEYDDFGKLLIQISHGINKFSGKIQPLQQAMYEEVINELTRLQVDNGKVKASVKNLSAIARLKSKLLKLIVTPEYKASVKEFLQGFNEITAAQNAYWKSVEAKFTPPALLKTLKEVTVEDTAEKLLESGIGVNVGDKITDILRQNITGGGSYADLTEQLRQNILNTPEGPGTLSKYARQITTDAINQYNGQYTQTVTNDLGYEWFKYDNTDIETTRPFCDAMTDIKYFHVSEVPAILKADGLTYVDKTGERVPVRLYSKTGLPHGMIPGTDASNFFVRRGGYNCGHQIRPVNPSQVPKEIKDRVLATPAYARWAAQQVVENKPRPQQQDAPRGSKPVDLDFLANPSEDIRWDIKIADAIKYASKHEGFPGLSGAEVGVISAYTGNFFSYVNRLLRGRHEDFNESEVRYLNEAANLLDNALAKSKRHVGPVTRGTRLRQADLDKYIARAKSGEIFEEEAFTSTAYEQVGAFPGNVKFYIKSKTGVNIRALGLDHEYEVLMNRGTKFRIKDYYYNKGAQQHIFSMEEVD